MPDQVIITPADSISLRRSRWLWDQRLPTIGLSLLAGREGVGKSTTDCWLAAAVTQGSLPGEYEGTPRNVLYIASEDDWETTLAPRLVAAGADMSRIFKMAVKRDGSKHEGQVELPEDMEAFDAALGEVEPALVVVSPLMSRVSSALDTHKDQSVRQALEPLVQMAYDRKVLVLGLIHLNKSTTTDPLRAVMSSAAFVAVARAVVFVARDPDDPEVRLVGEPKNNGGPSGAELGLLTFTIEKVVVGTDPDDGLPIEATRLVWGEVRDGSIDEVLSDSALGSENRTEASEAGDWLVIYLYEQGGSASKDDVMKAAKEEGYTEHSLRRARARKGITTTRTKTVPSTTVWSLPRSKQPPTVTRTRGNEVVRVLSATSTTSAMTTRGTRGTRAAHENLPRPRTDASRDGSGSERATGKTARFARIRASARGDQP